MDFVKAFELPFKDRKWLGKIFVGSLLVLISFILPFIGFPMLYGWALHTAQDIRNGEFRSLPKWSRAWSFFIDGLKFSIANLIWMAPFLILTLIIMLPTLVLLPEGIPNDPFDILLVFLLSFSMYPLLLWSFITPLQFGVAADTRSFVATINPIRAYKLLKEAPDKILIAWIVSAGLQYFLGQIGTWFFFVGYFPAIAFQMVFWGVLFGYVLYFMRAENPSHSEILANIRDEGIPNKYADDTNLWRK